MESILIKDTTREERNYCFQADRLAGLTIIP